MRIVATSDTHFPFEASRIPDGDVFVLAGDMMYDGSESEWHARIESLAALPHKFKIFVPGNHDYYPMYYRGIARSQLRREAGVTLVDDYNPMFLIDDTSFLCLPFVTGLPGWAFDRSEEWVYDYLTSALNDMGGKVPDVFITHSPPYKIRDAVGKNNYGCMAYNKWFYEPGHKPKTWICGHIHESYGHERIESTDFYNVAMCDEDYKQTNNAVIIDL